MPDPVEARWFEVARGARIALDVLGWGSAPRCMPGEPEECGGTIGQHAASYLAALQAVAQHQLDHMAAPETLVSDIYAHTLEELQAKDAARA